MMFSASDRQPRSAARRSSSAPSALAGGRDDGKDDVVLLRFAAPHTVGYMNKWLSNLMRQLPEDLPPHEVRILDFHDYITMIFGDADSVDSAGRILRRARPHAVVKDGEETERVVVIRDRPPEVRRRNVGLQPVYDAIAATVSGKARTIRAIHRARGKHQHSRYHLLDEQSDESQFVATVGWADDDVGFRVLSVEVTSGAPADVRGVAQLVLFSPSGASAPLAAASGDAEMSQEGSAE